MVNKAKKGILTRDTAVTNKTFAYGKDGVQLSFVLRTDIKGELKAFKEILKVALEDVTNELNSKK